VFAVVALGWALSCFAQGSAPASGQPPAPQSTANAISGSIRGTVVDKSGAIIVGAQVQLTAKDQSAKDQSAKDQSAQDQSSKDAVLNHQALSGDDGQFSFVNIPPGPFHLTVTSAGFSPQTISGVLHSGEACVVPQIVLAIATDITQVQVGLTRAEVAEVAEAQLKVEEKQRVLGAIPNFYVSYIPDAAPLTPKQKFQLAVKTMVDPFTFVVVAGSAGVQQAQDHFVGYGQGTEGYAKRFGANYADTASGTFIGGAILPWLLKQDPRYFYKGTGSFQYRFLYAIANAVICKGDNRHWQPNYSNVLGNLAAGGISNIYYPAQDRNGATLTLENAAFGIAGTAASNVLQEFLIKKLTPHTVRPAPNQP